MSNLRGIVVLGFSSGLLAWPGLGALTAPRFQEPAAVKGKMSPEDEAHFRALQKARRELRILEAQVALKKADIAHAEAEYMLRHLRAADAEDQPKPADPAPPGAEASKKGGSEDGPVHDVLDRVLAMPFPDATPLSEFLHYIKQATEGPGLPGGLQIFVEPGALKTAGQSMDSRVAICHDSLPLRKAITTALEPIGLDLEVKDGLVVVHAREAAWSVEASDQGTGLIKRPADR